MRTALSCSNTWLIESFPCIVWTNTIVASTLDESAVTFDQRCMISSSADNPTASPTFAAAESVDGGAEGLIGSQGQKESERDLEKGLTECLLDAADDRGVLPSSIIVCASHHRQR